MAFEKTRDEYDFIVVGSGAGGGPLVCNLARAGANVLLIEAGGDHEKANDPVTNDKYNIPAFHALSTEDPNLSWNFRVEHYTDRNQAKEDSKYQDGIFYPRAGTLGGCTSHYAMITLYPHDSDWDHIAEITGDDSWAADEMRQYFDRLEKWLPMEPIDRFQALQLGLHDKQFSKILLNAAKSGASSIFKLVRSLSNPNDKLKDGRETAGPCLIPTATDGVKPTDKGGDDRDGCRGGTREYILAVHEEVVGHGRNTFDILTNTLVTKVLLEDIADVKTAVGVEYLVGQHLYKPSAKHGGPYPQFELAPVDRPRAIVRKDGEVILCGGAFNTPQLLMLSGIGPEEHLQEMHIAKEVSLSGVGQNLQDRYEVGIVSQFNDEFETLEGLDFRPPENGEEGDKQYRKWQEDKSGLYATNGAVLTVIKKSTVAKLTGTDPDLFIFGVPGYFKGYFDGWSKRAALNKNEFTWVILKGHTDNTGEVTLKSPDPWVQPDINFKYFGDYKDGSLPDDGDLEAMAEAIEFVNGMNEELGDDIKASVVPGEPDVQYDLDTAEGRKRFVVDEAWGHHASCTCAIGKVLDSKFNVLKTKNLRVADASVFPKIPGLFIVVPVYMISEKASDVIIRDAREKALI